MKFVVEIEQEVDGRWIAEIPQIPGAMAYGTTREEAVARAEALGLRVLAERIEHSEVQMSAFTYSRSSFRQRSSLEMMTAGWGFSCSNGKR
jgi:predicted RNase H-like HicB family nuclease